MAEPSLQTTLLRDCVARMQAGDRAARDELLRAAGDRLESLARKMLRDFPRVKNWVDTGDVLQNALLRLLRALENVQPGSLRDFFGLAAVQIRRELIDLARHFLGPQGLGKQQAYEGGEMLASHPADEESSGELLKWHVFHEHVESLPAEEREVMSLIFYHGWTQAEVAELFQVTERTVRRWYQSARLKLHARLKEIKGRG